VQHGRVIVTLLVLIEIVSKSWEYAPVDRANATHVLAEAERALQTCPGEATFAWGYKAKALRALGRYQEALDAALNIPPEQFVFR
jgi:hypothetical protein